MGSSKESNFNKDIHEKGNDSNKDLVEKKGDNNNLQSDDKRVDSLVISPDSNENFANIRVNYLIQNKIAYIENTLFKHSDDINVIRRRVNKHDDQIKEHDLNISDSNKLLTSSSSKVKGTRA